MRLLESWIESRLAEAVGWTLLHSLWEGAVISAALGGVLAATRSPRARYAAACLALLMMLGVFGLTFVQLMPEGGDVPRSLRTHGFPARSDSRGLDVPGSSNPGLAAVVPWLALLWIGGVWIFYLRQAAAWMSVCRLRQRGVCCAPGPWQNSLARLSAQLRISRPVLLLESSLADAPMVLGHFRPVILMPIGLLAGLPAGQVEAILLHELAHIRRCDYLVNVIQRLAEGLLFYHPAVWWISRVIRAERENCCDDLVVGVNGDAQEYALALTALEQNRWPGREPAVAATGGSLVKRIRRLLYPTGPNGAWTPLFAAIVLIAILSAALAAWPLQPPQQGSSAAQAQQTSPFLTWLNQDVVYIIADEERAAFQKLTTDPEREKFIEQFWLRRDPTPGTAENEFKAEHYRRISYANDRFRTLGRPGWQTDRGHIYIVYGPPDEIEAHPKGTRMAYAFQVWMYRHVEGVGDFVSITFIDRTGSGDYRLAPGSAR